MNTSRIQELLLQSLEAEIGGVEIYQTAIECAVNADLRKEWQKYLVETRRHVAVLEGICEKMGIDVRAESPGRLVVRHIGQSLVRAMELAQQGADAQTQQLVACECVVLAETKDHTDWELIGQCARNMEGEHGALLLAAYEEVEDEEDSHLYHTRGWCRELWVESLGLDAVLPPPEETLDVKTAIGAAKAQASARAARTVGDTEPAMAR